MSCTFQEQLSPPHGSMIDNNAQCDRAQTVSTTKINFASTISSFAKVTRNLCRQTARSDMLDTHPEFQLAGIALSDYRDPYIKDAFPPYQMFIAKIIRYYLLD
ncbi:hypothetical protein K0M31_019694 [Melipona bicolor]|uniref:Uncharacterized protein n=1 Tax=Melipona bicolor TaxID=60889 RepID=A0AA40G2W2_9HYME|nr:hypothetical protein K0M31_019694 [Melipona bicolor]